MQELLEWDKRDPGLSEAHGPSPAPSHEQRPHGAARPVGSAACSRPCGCPGCRGDPCQLSQVPTHEQILSPFLKGAWKSHFFFGRSKIQQGNVRVPGSAKWQFSSAQRDSPAPWLPGQPPVWSARGGGSARGSESLRRLQQVVASAWLWCHPAQHGSEDTWDRPLGCSTGPSSRWQN